MARFQRHCDTLHIVSASLWAGVVAMAGLTAAVSFPKMRELQPVLAPYAAYEGEHWPIAAGTIANSVFFYADSAQLGLAMVAASTLGYLAFHGKLGGRVVGIVRLLALGVALLAFGFQLFFVRPEMDTDLVLYWEAARNGETQLAQTHRDAFNDRHPTVSRLMGLTAASSLVLAVAGGWGATRRDEGPSP